MMAIYCRCAAHQLGAPSAACINSARAAAALLQQVGLVIMLLHRHTAPAITIISSTSVEIMLSWIIIMMRMAAVWAAQGLGVWH